MPHDKACPPPFLRSSPVHTASALAGQSATADAADNPPPPALAPPGAMPLVQACRIVRHVVAELVMMTNDRVTMRRDRRRMMCHIRQIAMYVCHVSLSIPLSEIGDAFGRDRTTVSHACHVVEDRRDDTGYDELVSTVERLVSAIFARSEVPAYE